ncbi:polysaccharide lyase-like protein [Yoonia maricola]|uniref:Polysaccharide lyase-like protein n=1 Tax=Yoonia maricola TaxID=420999 RepID=A0A2M8WK12_9RHOB|nr:heparin lyase I family protein [Yoonia maricola]PJI91275.1 polysaccharide lyase-like protein [Yoonia maricola]
MKTTLFAMILPIALSACMTDTGTVSRNADVPLGHYRALTHHEHGFRYSADGEPVRAGQVSERFELRDGDCGGSDCTNPRYRSEVGVNRERTQARIGENIWYGWSFYNDNIQSYPSNISLMNVFGQWKMGGDNPPSIKLVQIGRGEAYRGGNRSHDVVIQMDDANEGLNWGERRNWGIVCRLFSIDQARGRWTDIVINTNFSMGNDGYLRVWINGIQRCNYSGPITVITDTSLYPGPNFRRGIYGSFTSRWDRLQPTTPKPTMIAYYDEFRVGRSRQDVDIRLIEQAGLPPVD